VLQVLTVSLSDLMSGSTSLWLMNIQAFLTMAVVIVG
jgi:hypothetical protein